MKARLLLVVFGMLLVAFSASAAIETVLTSDNVVYTVDSSAETLRLQLSRRAGDAVSAVPVPGTEDPDPETDTRLVWDAANSCLVVVWNHRTSRGDEILLARLGSDGWSEPIVVASSISTRRVSLQIELTRASIEGQEGARATFVHAAWWSINPAPVAEYALVAFEGGEHVSTYVDTLDDLLPLTENEPPAEDNSNIALHPPMAMVRTASGVDIVYGRSDSTSVRRVGLDPRRVSPNARAWRPVGRSAVVTGRSGFVAANNAPMQAMLTQDRIVIFSAGAHFRYMVFENGQWSPLRRFPLDETLSTEQIVDQLAK